jgi:3-methyladenine DNA glycosylase AlkC
MPDAFKHLIGPPLVHACSEHLHRAWNGFDRAVFERIALDGLEALEMKARAMQVADALQATLPADFGHACDIIDAALAPATTDDRTPRTGTHGLAGWVGWPLGEYVARSGLEHPARALDALHAITRRFTAEFAIRPFLERHFDVTLATLQHWCDDPSPHVRRLVSEGTRPRLPWGSRVRRLIDDPSPCLGLLARLQDDDSAYVRRSVANHLNDIAKDHPGIVADWLERHLPGAPAARRALLRHASRTLIKRGEPRVLAAWGIGDRFEGSATLALARACVRIGETLQLVLTLQAASQRTQRLAVDYIVHHLRADGRSSPRVFKGWSLELAPGEQRTLARRHSLKPVTTRRYYAGTHRIEIQVNGTLLASASFELQTAAAGNAAGS